eukprot:scaffold30419_cov31-Tisochrysis_lutea.AAC.8
MTTCVAPPLFLSHSALALCLLCRALLFVFSIGLPGYLQVLDAVSRMSIEQKVGQMTQIDVTSVVSYIGDCPTGFLWEDSANCQVSRAPLGRRTLGALPTSHLQTATCIREHMLLSAAPRPEHSSAPVCSQRDGHATGAPPAVRLAGHPSAAA